MLASSSRKVHPAIVAIWTRMLKKKKKKETCTNKNPIIRSNHPISLDEVVADVKSGCTCIGCGILTSPLSPGNNIEVPRSPGKKIARFVLLERGTNASQEKSNQRRRQLIEIYFVSVLFSLHYSRILIIFIYFYQHINSSNNCPPLLLHPTQRALELKSHQAGQLHSWAQLTFFLFGWGQTRPARSSA